ncbi:MAG: NUDIX domain-containing protein [Bacteroidetes bacterium]|nr:MAG: NUDIX domain-containing protein [Bacteroidota bacterium]
MEIKKFNIRVYGIVIHNKHVLLTDEFRLGMRMTKFPGGGLEFGEGTAHCLEREFREEIGQNIEIKEHIYTTDFFQPTRLLAEPQQLISIYYRVELRDYQRVPVSKKAFDFRELKEGVQSFRWIPLVDLKKETLTFPIDQKVIDIIKEKYFDEGSQV